MKKQVLTTNATHELDTQSNSTSTIVVEGYLAGGTAKLQFANAVDIPLGTATVGSVFTLAHGIGRAVFLKVEGGGASLSLTVSVSNVL